MAGKSEKALNRVRCFLKNLVEEATHHLSLEAMNESTYQIFRQGEGGVFLSPDKHHEFLRTCNELVGSFSRDDDLSRSAVETMLQETLLEVLDIQKQRDPSLCVRLDEAVTKLRTFLERESEDYECWFEVDGLEDECLPICFGRVSFSRFDEKQVRRLRKIVEKKHECDHLNKLAAIDQLRDSFATRSCAVVNVKARDKKAALTLAEREVRATVECLNFFSDLVPYNYGSLFLGERGLRGSALRLSISKGGSIHAAPSFVGPSGKLSISKLRSCSNVHIYGAVVRVDELLKKVGRNKVQELVLTAVRWAGRATIGRATIRATIEVTREESFLLFAVALECTILPTARVELAHRLSQRVAWLLGGDADQRHRLARRVAKLYGVRSKIVHDGHYEVTEVEQRDISAVAKEMIVGLLLDPTVKRCSTKKNLDEYLERRTLGSGGEGLCP